MEDRYGLVQGDLGIEEQRDRVIDQRRITDGAIDTRFILTMVGGTFLGQFGFRFLTQHALKCGEKDDAIEVLLDTEHAAPTAALNLKDMFEAIVIGFNGMITNDKFCCTRWDILRLSWWRRPKRLRGLGL